MFYGEEDIEGDRASGQSCRKFRRLHVYRVRGHYVVLGEGLYNGSACVKLKVREVSGSGFIRGI